MELLQMLVLEPKYVILDEPDSGMDADSVRMIDKALKKIASESGILIISHHPQNLMIDDLNEVMVIKKGQIVKKGETELIDRVAKSGYGGI
jgi:Fe-S cluster assembly ATP-binding protein